MTLKERRKQMVKTDFIRTVLSVIPIANIVLICKSIWNKRQNKHSRYDFTVSNISLAVASYIVIALIIFPLSTVANNKATASGQAFSDTKQATVVTQEQKKDISAEAAPASAEASDKTVQPAASKPTTDSVSENKTNSSVISESNNKKAADKKASAEVYNGKVKTDSSGYAFEDKIIMLGSTTIKNFKKQMNDSMYIKMNKQLGERVYYNLFNKEDQCIGLLVFDAKTKQLMQITISDSDTIKSMTLPYSHKNNESTESLSKDYENGISFISNNTISYEYDIPASDHKYSDYVLTLNYTNGELCKVIADYDTKPLNLTEK